MLTLNNKRVINGWCMFDWANSVYSLVITSAIFPIYYASVTFVNGSDLVSFFGISIKNTVLYSYSLSFSFLVVASIIPLLTGIADYMGKKKLFMKLFTFLGSFSCIGLYFFTGQNIEFGIILSVLASIGFSGSLVFYNSFLPEIASEDKYDIVSAKGFSYGYFGSVLLLIFNLIMIQTPQSFGLPDGSIAARFSFLLVGIWWIGFAQISFNALPSNPYQRKPEKGILTKGYKEISKVWRSLANLPNLKKFLGAFFFYNTGVQTFMYLAVLFGTKELGLDDTKLIFTILLIQIVAIGGSYMFAKVSEFKGNKFSLLVMIQIWILVCIWAYFITEYQFYALAFVVGIIMGGIQALSRATYSKLIPENTIDHASYFSFYDVTYNVSIVFGTFAFGFIDDVTGSMRLSALALGGFFIIGYLFLKLVQIPSSSDVESLNTD